MIKSKFVLQMGFTYCVSRATTRAACPLARMAALQLGGCAGYSSSSRLALHPMGRTARAVRLPFLG